MDSSIWNEVDILPLAKHYADPSWVSQDWYLSQAGGYRFLFELTFGWLIVNFGFLATSILGRLCCYSLVAIGLVLIGQQLRLSLPFLLLATVFFAGQGVGQGASAGEWIVGSLEAKAVAYGLILIAIALMLAGRYLGMAFLLGLATSFHVLVGGWAFLTTLGWFCLRPSTRLSKLREIYPLLLLLYVAASAVAIPSVVQQFASTPESAIAPSYIYVFLRLSHHLNPFAWRWLWIKLIISLLLFGAAIVRIKRQANFQGWSETDFARSGLAEFALVSLIPWVCGLAIAPFDAQGQWLQYYPFRFADVIVPLTTCLLIACVLEHRSQAEKRLKSLVCIVLLVIFGAQTALFAQDLLALQQFPSQQQNVDPQWKVMSEWIRFHTPKDAIVVSHPIELANFTWLTERSTIAKFKLFPQTQDQILEQYKRLNDLSGNYLAAYVKGGKVNKRETIQVLSAGFEQLSTSQAEALMNKYGASFFLTNVKNHLNFEVAYRYDPYILYMNKPNQNCSAVSCNEMHFTSNY